MSSLSLVEERFLHTEEVRSSNLLASTIHRITYLLLIQRVTISDPFLYSQKNPPISL